MRDSWTEITFGDVFKIVAGKYVAKEEYVEGGEFWIYGSNSIMGKLDRFLVEQSHVVMAAIGAYAGAVRYSKEPSWINNNAMALVPSDKIMAKYLHLWLESEFDLKRVVVGTGQPYVQRPLLLKEIIELPPLPEQKRIVDLISSVDSYIEALQQQLESAKKSRNALIESQILELSDHSLLSLKNLSTKIGSGATPRGGEEVYIETGVNLIRSQNVHDSNFIMRGLVAIEDSAAKALENVTVEEGDVLINITGASVTRCCVVDSTILPARVNQHVAIIRSDRAQILPKYLVLILTSNEVKGFLNDIAGTGSTRQALTKTHLENLEIPVPKISKQAEIIENSDAFDLTISKIQITLDGAKILRSGLLNDLLSGEHEIPASYDKVMGAA
jgi:restriction endonuclease S subunit